MNERIRELFESEVYPSFAGTIGTGLRRNLRGEYLSDNLEDHWQTFQEATELIVRECVQTLIDNTPERYTNELAEEDWDKGYDRAMTDCVHHIKEHFGVEE